MNRPAEHGADFLSGTADLGLSPPPALNGWTYDELLNVNMPFTGAPFNRLDESWFAVINGKTQWILVDPSEPIDDAPWVKVDANNVPYLAPCSILSDMLPTGAAVCVQEPGEVLFLPSGWWHSTCALSTTVTVGMTNSLGYIPQTPIPKLHQAVLRGDATAIDAALLSGDPVDEVHNGVTALHLAARSGRAEVARLLLQRGAKVEATGRMGLTALHWAVANGSAELAKLLVEEYGADPHAQDDDGREAPANVLAEILAKELGGKLGQAADEKLPQLGLDVIDTGMDQKEAEAATEAAEAAVAELASGGKDGDEGDDEL
jgi:hypothetical protein